MWKPVYDKRNIYIASRQEAHRDPVLIIAVKDFHLEEYPLAEIYEKSGCLQNYDWPFEKKVRAIADYCIANALFPYPVEELV
jgi:hypothetical protein